jgi:hypothetical protein
MLQVTRRGFVLMLLPVCALGFGACSSSSKPAAAPTNTTAAAPAGSNTAVASNANSIGCSLVSADQVASTLGVQALGPTSQPNGQVTVCLYASSANPNNTTIRYETGMSASDFTTAQAQFDQNGEKTTPVNGIGDKAYSSSIGSVNTLVVLKGQNEVLISAPASLAKITALANQIVPKL